MLKTIIVDNEYANRKLLTNLLHTFCPQINLLAEADTVDSAFKEISEKKPDLVFLDIQMLFENEFQLFKKLETISFETIFIANNNQYAVKAIKLSALDFLLKPFDNIELKDAVNKAIAKSEKENHYQFLNQNFMNKTYLKPIDKKIIVHINSNSQLISMNEIAYIEADSNYSSIHLMNGKTHHTAMTLKKIEELTFDLSNFVRINRNIVINTAFCSFYKKGEPYSLELKNGSRFNISRRKRSKVIRNLKDISSPIIRNKNQERE